MELKVEAQRIVEADRAAAFAPVAAAMQLEAERLKQENQRKIAEIVREEEEEARARRIDWKGFAKDQSTGQIQD